MLQDYSEHRPGTTIKQLLAVEAQTGAPTMMAVVVGPRFLLNRYGVEEAPSDAFNAAGQEITWRHLLDDVITDLDLDLYSIDQTRLKLYGVGLEATLATFTAAGSPSFTLASLDEPNVLKLSAGHVAGASLAASFRGRNCAIGDTVVCVGISGGTTYKRKITGLRGVVAAGTFGANSAGSDSNAGNSSSNPITTVASATQISAPASWSVGCAAPEDFNGLSRGAKNITEYGEEFIITVHTAGAPATGTVNIASASGKYNATNVATVDSSGNFSITDTNAGGELGGVDLLLTTPGAALSVGMSFRIRVLGDYSRLTTSQVVPSGTYDGVKDTTYMVRVTGVVDAGTSFTGATVTITDTAGIDTPQENVELTNNTNIDLGSFGLSIKFNGSVSMPDHAGLRVGDIYFVHAKAGAVSTTNFDQVVLDGPAVDTLVFDDVEVELYSVEFRLAYTGEIAADAHEGGEAWTADAESMTVTAALGLEVTARSSTYEWCDFVTGVGTLVASWRAFVLAGDANVLHEVTTAAELLAAAGDNDLDNDLGFAGQQAFLGSSGKTIGILNTGGDTDEAYAAALALIENNRAAYGLMILGDQTVWDTAKTHVISASSESNRNFRHMRVAVDSPGSYSVLSKRADTTNFTCTISSYGGGFKLVTIAAGADESSLTDLGLVAGDILKLTASAEEFTISSIVSDTELLLSAGPDAAVDPAVTFEIWKADTVESQKSWLIQRALSLGDRRASLVWTERAVGLVNDVSTVIPARYGAAYITGLRSALRPQIGTTRQTVGTYTGASRMYDRYSRADLDELAAYGIQIITQDHAGSPVRIRHQATTDVSNGITNFEESTTVRFDYLSFQMDNALDIDIGNVNTTDAYVEEARSKVLALLAESRQVPLNASYGPLIDDFNGLVVQRHATFLDRIETFCNIEIGPPLNRHAVQLTAYGRLPTTDV